MLPSIRRSLLLPLPRLSRPISRSPAYRSDPPKPASEGKQEGRSEGEIVPSGSDKASQQSAQAIAHQAHLASGLTGHTRDTSVVTAEVTSGAPAELLHRPVRIYKPSKSTMQSGKAGLNHWRLDFDALAGSGRWINPLMGWASSADYMQGTSIKFQTEEEAVRFCEKQGWEYIVQKPNVQPFKPKTYSENYTYVPGPLRIARTK